MPILAYHMVEPGFDLAVTRVTPAQFERQIKLALTHGFDFCTLSEYLHDSSAKRLAITFDDGYASAYRYAFPILQRYGLPATVFVIVGYVGQYDDWDVNFGSIRFPHLKWHELEKLHQAGWQIESHSMYHNDLRKITKSACLKELELSKALLEHRLAETVRFISFPFGNVDGTVIECCLQAGYEGGVVMSGIGGGLANSFTRQRTGIYYFDTEITFLHKILAKYEKTYKFMQDIMDVCSNGTVLVKHGVRVTKR